MFDSVAVLKIIAIIIFLLTACNFALYFLLQNKNAEITKYNEQITKYNQQLKEGNILETQINTLKNELCSNQSCNLFLKRIFTISVSDKILIQNFRIINSSGNSSIINKTGYAELKNESAAAGNSGSAELNFFIECSSINENNISRFVTKIKQELKCENISYEISNTDKNYIGRITGDFIK